MSMKKAILIPLTTAIVILTGCNEKIYDVDYYVNNIKEAEQMQQKCEKGEVANKNCENARNALKQINRKKTISSMFAH
ncbi:EexN family lipoprotein [Escherichia albertii]|uniref:EexN family lipoprotein n=1 Tax=Escherichia albertii TaxID=208962 RepID=UPI000C14E78D|nr:EexN family lipoprotein [Escherichia albertii]EFS3795138.1 EexN family lipoprotein [Escherichia coli]EKD4816001.1 EexN family lipoprotein [Escherichia albertii]EKY9433051.1 EexN family lipoprotein [Escherichia coli]